MTFFNMIILIVILTYILKTIAEATTDIPHNIWLYWDQGLPFIDKHTKRTVESWSTRNPDFRVTIVTNKTLPLYITENDLDIIRLISRKEKKANLVRLALLERYGGIWTDVDVYCVMPLKKWLPKYTKNTGFWNEENCSKTLE